MNYNRIFIIACLILLPFVVLGKRKEAFDHSLRRLNTLESLNLYIDSLMLINNVPCDSREEVLLVNNVIENRFYHGYCHYAPKENWVAYLAGKYVRYDLSAIVITEDILKYDYAACSQQSIVMMRVLKSRGFRVRKLGLVGHFALEAFHDNAWHFYDPNLEPLNQGIEHDSLESMWQSGSLIKFYHNSLSPDSTQIVFSSIEIGKTNEYPAKNARFFHKVTKLVSQYLMLILICTFGGVFFIWKQRRKRMIVKEIRSKETKVLV